jgi:hypothetical protein
MEDPSSPCSSSISPADLDAARLAFGTDEDVLVVSKCEHDALQKSQTNAELGNFVQTKVPSLSCRTSNFSQHQAEKGDGETYPAGSMLQMQRIPQASNITRNSGGNSQEREALVQ